MNNAFTLTFASFSRDLARADLLSGTEDHWIMDSGISHAWKAEYFSNKQINTPGKKSHDTQRGDNEYIIEG